MKLPIERVDRDRFIGVDDLRPMDMSKRLHVIACGVGLGKSSLVLDAKRGFMGYLRENVGDNLTAEDVVFLTPRRILRDNPGVFMRQFDVDTIQGYAQSVMGREEGKRRFPRVVVIDEVHLLFRECEFCDEMGTLLDEIEHGRGGTVWVGLTATPSVLDWLGNGLSFEYLTNGTMVKYGIDRITVAHGNGLARFAEVLFRDEPPSGDRKAWVQVSDKNEGVKLRDWLIDQGVSAVFVCSKGNDKGKECDERAYGWLANPSAEGFPPDVDAIVTTSVTEVGITVREPALRTVVVDSIYPDTIIQVCGRFRGDIGHLCVLNRYTIRDIQRKKDAFEKSAGVVESVSNNSLPQERGNVLLSLLGLLFDKDKGTQRTVVRSLDGIHYSVNYRLRDLYSYQMACARSACSYGEDSKAVEYYKGMFDCYGGDRNIEFVDIRRKAPSESEIIDRIKEIDLSAFCGRLTSEKSKEMVGVIDVRDKNGRTLGINAISKYLPYAGYSLSDWHKANGSWYRMLEKSLDVSD